MKILDPIGNFFLKSKLRLLLLIGFIVILSLLLFLYPSKTNQKQTKTSQRESLTTPNKPNLEQLVVNKKRLIEQLPYNGDGYTVEYFPDQDYFFIQVNKSPYNTYKSQAESWLRNYGVEPEFVNIEWSATREVAP
ncbi:MAG: hypothetical protein HYU80_00555 [Candidatus Blackburnbacteria bacterium]|nr:hypothetical protein [Candidatus Blackburnbacteria bacterium]